MIRFQNVNLKYGIQKNILQDISFNIYPGSFQFLTGSPGSGKTSLLYLIFMILKPSSGKIYIFNRDTSLINCQDLPIFRRNIGVIFNNSRFFNHMTVYENISLPLRIHGYKEKEYKYEVKEFLNWIGLQKFENKLPFLLSSEEMKRAIIARALISRPFLLLADEPMNGVDNFFFNRFLKLFMEINNYGTSMIIVDHNLSLMSRVDAIRMVINNQKLEIYD